MARRSPKVVHPDRDVLKTFLAAAARPAGTLQYHQLQGFLFAVASSPEIILPSEWMPVVFAGHEAGYRTISRSSVDRRRLDLQQFGTAAYAGRGGFGVPAGTGLRYGCLGSREAPGRATKADMKKDVNRILRENRRVIDEALIKAVRETMLRHKKDAMPVVIERGGKIEWVKPEDLGY